LNLRGEGKKILISQRGLYRKLVQIRGWVEKTTIGFLEIKNLSRGGGQNCLFVVTKMKNGWEG